MTKREKGLAFQRWIKKWMEGRGWTVHNQVPMGTAIKVRDNRTIFVSQRNDIFGADLIARQFDYGFGIGTVHWIQATLDSNIKRKVDEFKKYFKNTLEGESLQIWVKTKKGGVNIKEVVIFNKKASVRDIGKIVRGKIYYSERPNSVV